MNKSVLSAALGGVILAASTGLTGTALAANMEGLSPSTANNNSNVAGDTMLSPWTPYTRYTMPPTRTFLVPGLNDAANSGRVVRVMPNSAAQSRDVLIVPETGVLVIPYSDVQ